MEAARGQPDHRIALADGRAIDDRVAFHDAHREADHFEIAFAVNPGHCGGFSAEERTPGPPAALGETPKGIRGDLLLQPGHGNIVEEN